MALQLCYSMFVVTSADLRDDIVEITDISNYRSEAGIFFQLALISIMLTH